MGGTTLHAGGDIAVGGQSSRQLHHTDVDVLFARNQHLRFVLDEIGMIPDDLLGAFAEHYTDAAAQTRFSKRADKSNRVMGGCNLLMFGDLYQLPPIPASAAVSTPRMEKNGAGEASTQSLLGRRRGRGQQFYRARRTAATGEV